MLVANGILIDGAEKRTLVRAELQDGTGQAQPPSAEGTPGPSSTQPTPLLSTTALPQPKSIDDSGEMDVDDLPASHANGKLGAQSAKDAHPPQKRYRLTDQMKHIIWQLVCLSNECCRIENEKKCVLPSCFSGDVAILTALLQSTGKQPSDRERPGRPQESIPEGASCLRTAARAIAHRIRQIVAVFPEGWLSSGQISREVSVMKKKYEKEAMEAMEAWGFRPGETDEV